MSSHKYSIQKFIFDNVENFQILFDHHNFKIENKYTKKLQLREIDETYELDIHYNKMINSIQELENNFDHLIDSIHENLKLEFNLITENQIKIAR